MQVVMVLDHKSRFESVEESIRSKTSRGSQFLPQRCFVITYTNTFVSLAISNKHYESDTLKSSFAAFASNPTTWDNVPGSLYPYIDFYTQLVRLPQTAQPYAKTIATDWAMTVEFNDDVRSSLLS